MAKAPKGQKGEKEKSGGGIVGLIIVTLLAAGGGAGFGFYIFGQLGGAAPAKPAPEAQKVEEQKPAIASSSKLVELAPIVANLAEPRDVWMRVEASILVEGSPEGVDVLSRQVSEDIVAYLKTASLAQFEGASGFQNLREDLMDRARVRDGEHIKDLIIHGIVVE
jgi:flagellar FliL protein